MDVKGESSAREEQPQVATASTTGRPDLDQASLGGFPRASGGETTTDLNDSASDISMTTQTDDEPSQPLASEEVEKAPPAPSPLQPAATSAGVVSAKKRKPSDGGTSDDFREGMPRVRDSKKVQRDVGCSEDSISGLPSGRDGSRQPAEIWHRIFIFCPPRSLGNLLQVNKLFHSYLDPSSTVVCEYPQPLSTSLTPALKPNAIWQASRRLFWPFMPSPLQDKTELDMWRLALPLTCQFCGKRGVGTPTHAMDQLHGGPGPEGVAIAWPFASRSCGPCLLSKSTKVGSQSRPFSRVEKFLTRWQEIDLLLSSSFPSALIPALPFILLTSELHILPPAVLVERGSLPAGTAVTKFFWSAHLESLKQEFFSVKDLGPSVAEEWIKGLEGRGSEKRHDSSRWEKYAASAGVAQMRTLLYPGYQPKLVPLSPRTATPDSRLSGDVAPKIGRSTTSTPEPTGFSFPPYAPISSDLLLLRRPNE